jgi:subtilisin family serine protease
VEIIDLIPRINVHCSGVGDPLTTRVIEDALMQFCRDTNAWRFFPEDIAVEAGTSIYTPVTPTNEEQNQEVVIVDIIDAYLVSANRHLRNIGSRGMSTVEQFDPTDNSYSRIACVTEYVKRLNLTQIQLFPTPTTSDTLRLELAIAPARTWLARAGIIDDLIAEEYWEAIEANALWRLMSMPQKSWSDSRAALIHLANYNTLKAQTKLRAERDTSPRTLVVGYGGI